jgi:hypothetical protein
MNNRGIAELLPRQYVAAHFAIRADAAFDGGQNQWDSHQQ